MPFLYDDVGEARAGILGQNLPNSLTGEVRYESLSECEETVDQIYGLYHHDDYDGEESNRTGLHPGYPSRSTSVEPYDTNELLELDGEDQLSQINESVLSRSESDIVMDQIYQHLGMETPPEADFLSDEGSDDERNKTPTPTRRNSTVNGEQTGSWIDYEDTSSAHASSEDDAKDHDVRVGLGLSFNALREPEPITVQPLRLVSREEDYIEHPPNPAPPQDDEEHARRHSEDSEWQTIAHSREQSRALEEYSGFAQRFPAHGDITPDPFVYYQHEVTSNGEDVFFAREESAATIMPIPRHRRGSPFPNMDNPVNSPYVTLHSASEGSSDDLHCSEWDNFSQGACFTGLSNAYSGVLTMPEPTAASPLQHGSPDMIQSADESPSRRAFSCRRPQGLMSPYTSPVRSSHREDRGLPLPATAQRADSRRTSYIQARVRDPDRQIEAILSSNAQHAKSKTVQFDLEPSLRQVRELRPGHYDRMEKSFSRRAVKYAAIFPPLLPILCWTDYGDKFVYWLSDGTMPTFDEEQRKNAIWTLVAEGVVVAALMAGLMSYYAMKK